ncbi:MAG TPA: ribonuclease III [Bryobacteraceae bacterium]|jgi:ribonuclease-3|nr:ribonuclease III [Bryobacteraceae bacterium]
MRADLDTLEAAIGHRFADRDVLHRALTHSSHVHEQALASGSATARDNEQLEFLGDSVLGFLISEDLLQRHPEAAEGRLSKLKAHLVSATWLHEAAQRLCLGEYLELGRGEEMSGGRSKKTLLVDALEALIAAIYLDGGMEPVRQFVQTYVVAPGLTEPGLDGEQLPQHLTDYKSALQEFAQARRLPPPRYVIVHERGPEHSKTFTVEARMGREWVGQAEGNTKKSAAQKAARDIYERLQSSPLA